VEKNPILIIDDESSYLQLMKEFLNQEGYTNVLTEQNPLNVLSLLERTDIDLILLDIFMPEMNGLELLEKIYASFPNIPVIVITAVDEVQIALRAIKLGAYEFITKPPDTDRLLLTIRRALDNRLLTSERDSLRRALVEQQPSRRIFSDIITDSPLVHKVFELVEIFAPTNETVFISGETGTGKDMIARKIHDLSPRRDKPFVAVNLASISPSLFESELFGYKKGTFTGAVEDKIGYFEAANSGTIFLDEIGELPLALQGKILRTIQYNEIYKIGDTKPVQLDIRIISATNQNIEKLIEDKRFRIDLYHRINSFIIHITPLRDRPEDIEPLLLYFIKMFAKKKNKAIPKINRKVIKELKKYHFPGNVRELKNMTERAMVLCTNETLDLSDFIVSFEKKKSKINKIT